MRCQDMITFSREGKPGQRFYFTARLRRKAWLDKNKGGKMPEKKTRKNSLVMARAYYDVMKKEAKKMPDVFLAEYQEEEKNDRKKD